MANVINGNIITHYMEDVISTYKIHDLNGKFIKDVELPGLGVSYGFGGNNNQSVSWYNFESLVHPPTVYMYDFSSYSSKEYYSSKAKFDKDKYVMKRDFYESKDGTRVPIFIAHSKDLVLDGLAPTLLYGYGKAAYMQLPAQEEVVSMVKSGMRLGCYKISKMFLTILFQQENI
jgi:prolyl oligopeptidase